MSSGRFATAVGVFISGALFVALDSSYPMVRAFGALIDALGMIAIWFAPDTSGNSLDDQPRYETTPGNVVRWSECLATDHRQPGKLNGNTSSLFWPESR